MTAEEQRQIQAQAILTVSLEIVKVPAVLEAITDLMVNGQSATYESFHHKLAVLVATVRAEGAEQERARIDGLSYNVHEGMWCSVADHLIDADKVYGLCVAEDLRIIRLSDFSPDTKEGK
jgi:hypothetical protein